MIKLECGEHFVYVDNVAFASDIKHLGCSFVNDGHDDLFDQGFTAEKLREHGLKVSGVSTVGDI